jgi:hypothetical protein
MSLCTAEPSGEKILRAVPGDRDPHRPASQAEYIQVIVLHSLAGRKVIVTKSRSRPAYLIGSHGGAYAAAAHENAALYVSTCHSAGEGDRKIGVVIVGIMYFVAKIEDLMTCSGQQFDELLFHFKTAVICAYANFHIVLPFSYELGAARSGSSPQLQCLSR